MKILVDADACPVVAIVEKVAKEKDIPVILVCDNAHVLRSEYSQVVTVDRGTDAVDFKLLSLSEKGDVIVTQDYGVAVMAHGKGVKVIHQSGKWYTNDNIDTMLMERHIAKCERRKSNKSHLKGPRKRTGEDDVRFEESFRKMLG
ncbi:MAG: YaiI/YqxD family protein [Clostridiales bacterium]|nr:YaiI/YqxD family protein [Clostridiales bacterium]